MKLNGVNNDEAIYEKKRLEDTRSPFARDADRILHSKAFTRYLDKTQVFSFEPNDFISHRVIHVYLLCRIAQYIGRELNLNTELIEAIAWGHDIGHCPFGHIGEKYLSDLTLKKGGYHFSHNTQSFEWLQRLERRENSKREFENGLNLSFQTLDGIVNHNGENFELERLKPSFKYDFAILEEQIIKRYKYGNKEGDSIPATLEGCVVRFSDVISYITRDIEDARTLQVIENYPPTPLGQSHGEIITTLMEDLVKNSKLKRGGENYLAYSNDTREALKELYFDFNFPKIYTSKRNIRFDDFVEKMFESIFSHSTEELLQVLEIKETHGEIFRVAAEPELANIRVYKDHIAYVDPALNSVYKTDDRSEQELKKLKLKIIVDYISGMTDRYCIGTYCHYEEVGLENIKQNSDIGEIIERMFFRKRFI